MKHVILSVILLLLTVSLAAQKFNGGILAGGLVSQVDGDQWEGYDKFGFLVGGMVSLRLSPHSSFQMEMEYIQKGSRKNSHIDRGDYDSELMRIHYLEIPVLYQYTFLRRMAVEAGPAMDVLLGSYEERNDQEVVNVIPLRNVTLSGIIGVSGYITGHLKAVFRFNYSLISIRETDPDLPDSYRKILFERGQYSNLLSLSLCWDFKKREF